MGTGNYHAGNARSYTDFGLFTCDDALGHDMTELFNYLTTGYKPKRQATARSSSRPSCSSRRCSRRSSARSSAHQRDEGGGLIQLKVNALEDGDIIAALYRASQAGVRVELVVRDTCRLRPGIPGCRSTSG